MNRYGRLLMSQWWTADPERYQAIPDPEAFFTSLGEQVEAAIQTLSDELARTVPPRPDYLAEVGRLNMLRSQAEELVLADLTIAVNPTLEQEDATSVSLVAEVHAVLDRIDTETNQPER